MNKAVFLDRDGVINYSVVRDGKPYPPDTLEDFRFYEDVEESLTKLKSLGYLLIIVTNQPDVATGKQTRETVETMHQIITLKLPIDLIKVCYEIDSPECRCYKPKPGMLLEAANEMNIDLAQSYMIGDRWRDIGAGKNAGCKGSILIERDYTEKNPYIADFICKSLLESSNFIVMQELRV